MTTEQRIESELRELLRQAAGNIVDISATLISIKGGVTDATRGDSSAMAKDAIDEAGKRPAPADPGN